MPRPQRAPKVESNSLTASAAQMVPSRSPSLVSSRQSWQDRAWGYFDSVGELQYAANWFGAALSRARLYTATRKGREFDSQESGPAVDVLAAFFDGPEGQAQAMSQMGVHPASPRCRRSRAATRTSPHS
jgi:hypothetical protein